MHSKIPHSKNPDLIKHRLDLIKEITQDLDAGPDNRRRFGKHLEELVRLIKVQPDPSNIEQTTENHEAKTTGVDVWKESWDFLGTQLERYENEKNDEQRKAEIQLLRRCMGIAASDFSQTTTGKPPKEAMQVIQSAVEEMQAVFDLLWHFLPRVCRSPCATSSFPQIPSTHGSF